MSTACLAMPLPMSRETQSEPDDFELVRRARSGDVRSFEQLYRRHVGRVHGAVWRLSGMNPARAEELAQEALLRLWQRAAMYDPQQGAVSTWLFRIGRNLHIDRIRREPGWVQVLEEAAPASDEELARPFTSAEDYAEHVHLQRRIEDLPAVQARLMRMSYFEAKSHQEIADELQMPLGTVKSHLRRAFLRLQGQVRGQP